MCHAPDLSGKRMERMCGTSKVRTCKFRGGIDLAAWGWLLVLDVVAVESGLFGLLGREWVEMEIHPQIKHPSPSFRKMSAH